MNQSRQNDANDALQRSRRRWMGAAIGVALPSLVMERDVSAANILIQHTVVPLHGPIVWRPIPDPTNPANFIPSSSPAGTVLAIPTANSGARTATWTANGLSAGYYKVTIYFPKHSQNATGVLVQKQQTRDAGFITWKTRLNQQVGTLPDGTPDTNISNVFRNTYKDVTPYATSKAASYIFVQNNTSNQPNSGTLSIRLSDGGCIGGRIVADKVVLEYQGAI